MNKKHITPEEIATRIETPQDKKKRVVISEFVDDIRENEEKLASLGVNMIPTEESDEDLKKILTLDDEDISNSIDLFPEMQEMIKKGKYTIEIRSLGLMYMEAFRNEGEPDMPPLYNVVSKIMGIPRGTLRFWWLNKDRFRNVRSMVHEHAMDYLQDRTLAVLLKMTHELGRRDFSEMSDKDFGFLFNTLINKYRLLSGQSTSNVAVRKTTIPLQDGIPDEED